MSDITIQGNNTEFPTDAGLYKKVMDGRRRIAREAKVDQRQNYSRPIDPLLEQMETGGMKLPRRLLKKDGAYARRKKRHPFRFRSGIEPLIGHLEHDHRMLENYLWGQESGTINAMLAATAWNLKKLMKEFRHALLRILYGSLTYRLCALQLLY